MRCKLYMMSLLAGKPARSLKIRHSPAGSPALVLVGTEGPKGFSERRKIIRPLNLEIAMTKTTIVRTVDATSMSQNALKAMFEAACKGSEFDACTAAARQVDAPETDPKRVLTQSRINQGFVSQEHLDAFYRSFDHAESCDECKRPGEPMILSDGAQPTTVVCPVGQKLTEDQFAFKAY